MQLLELASRCLQQSLKNSDICKEIRDLQLSIECIQTALKSSTSTTTLNASFVKQLEASLQEAEELLLTCNSRPSLWRNLRSLLPGSEIEKLQKMTERFKDYSQFIHLQITVARTQERRTLETHLSQAKKKLQREEQQAGRVFVDDDTLPDSENFGTLPEDGDESSDEIPPDDTTSFSVRVIGTKSVRNQCEKIDTDHLFRTWREPFLLLERRNFAGLEERLVRMISKKHLKIEGTRRKLRVKRSPIKASQSTLTQAEVLVTPQPTSKSQLLSQDERPLRVDPEFSTPSKLKKSNSLDSSHKGQRPSHDNGNRDDDDDYGRPLTRSAKRRRRAEIIERGTRLKETFCDLNGEDKPIITMEEVAPIRSISDNLVAFTTITPPKLHPDSYLSIPKMTDALTQTDSQVDSLNLDAMTQVDLDSFDQTGSTKFYSQTPNFECPEIYQIEEKFTIIDLSSNGTYLNGERLKKNKVYELKDGDLIGVVMDPETSSKKKNPQPKLGYKFLTSKLNL